MLRRIGRYELKAELGRGGFGRVFRAYDPTVSREVAIKLMSADSGLDADMLGRFKAEAAVTGNLHHKNIVTVYDYDVYEGVPYIVMELLEGEDLERILKRKGSLSLLEKVGIMKQVAEGLHYAHQKKIVHRDMKPANVMLLADGTVKIMDFGIARLINPDATRRTREGEMPGSLAYMAPEQFQGKDADTLSDIFAYGLIYYELVCGTHPFRDRDGHSDIGVVIFRITAMDPAPLRQQEPLCPEVLESVINRAIAKDPQDRYQSMEDVLLDTAPILSELQRQHASAMMAEVRALVSAGDLTAAQTKLRVVLDLDPTQREAQRMRQQIFQELQRHSLKARAQAMSQEAEKRIESRQYQQAIELLESARKLDASDRNIEIRLLDVNRILEAGRRATQLFADAQKEFQSGNLTGAYTNVLESLKADPTHADAAQLRDRLQKQLDARERQRRLARTIKRAEEYLALGEHGAALALLGEIEPERAGMPEVVALRARIEAEQAAEARRQRRQRIQAGLRPAKEAIESNNLAKAAELLGRLKEEFGEEPEIDAMAREMRERVALQQRSETLAKYNQDARNLIANRRFAECRSLLEQALQTFRDDSGLLRLLETATAMQKAQDRAQAVQQAVAAAEALRAQKKIEEALNVVSAALGEVGGDDTSLNNVHRQLEFELQQELYVQGLRKSVAASKEFLKKRGPTEAIPFIEKACRDFPNEPELASLLETARRARAAEEERKFLNQTLSETAALERVGNYEEGLRKVEDALKKCPDHPELIVASERLQEMIRLKERRKLIDQRIAEVRESLTSGNWVLAEEVASAAVREFPEEAMLEDLRRQAAANRRTTEKERLLSEINQCIETEKFDVARSKLAAAKQENDPRWTALGKELERRARYRKVLDTAENQRRDGKYVEAEKALLEEVSKAPPDNRASTLLQAITVERAAREREAGLRGGLEEAQRLLQRNELARAVAWVDSLDRQYGDDPRLRNLRQDVNERLEAEQRDSQRRQAIARSLDLARSLEQSGQATAALDEIDTSLRKYPDDPELQATAQRLRDLVVSQQRRNMIAERAQAIERALSKADWGNATQILKTGQKEFPEDTIWNKFAEKLSAESRKAQLDDLNAQVQASFARNDLDAAGRLLASCEGALSREPAWQELQRDLQRRREGERAQKERAQRLNDGIARADRLNASGNLAEAIEAVETLLRDYPDEDRLVSRRRTFAALRAEKEDRDAVRQVLNESARLKKAGKWEEALGALETALKVRPKQADLVAERDAIRLELEQRKSRETREALNRAAAFEQSGQLDAAIECLESFRATYPPDGQVDSTLSRIRERKRLEEALAGIEEQLALEDWTSALSLIDTARKRFADTTAFDGLRRRAVQAKQEEEFKAKYESIQTQVVAGDLDRGEKLLTSAFHTFGQHPSLAKLQAEIENGKKRRRLLSAAELLIKDRKYAEAEARVNELLAANADDDDAQRVLGIVREHQRRQQYEAGLDEARKLMRERQWGAAVAACQSLLSRFPEDGIIEQELQRAAEAKRNAEQRETYLQVASEADRLVQERQFDTAIRRLESLRRELPNGDLTGEKIREISELKQQYERKEAYTKGRAQADKLLKDRKFEPAIRLLEKLLTQFPGDVALEEALQAARAAREAHEKRETYIQGRETVENLMRDRQFDAAIETIQKLLIEFPKDPAFEEELKAAREAKKLYEQRVAVNERVAELEKLYRKGDTQGVKEKAAALLAEFEEPRARELLEWSRSATKKPGPAIYLTKPRLVSVAAVVVLAVAGLLWWVLTATPGDLKVSPPELKFSSLAGKESEPKIVTIRSAKPAKWAVSAENEWLVASPSSGNTPGSATVSVNSASLAPGPYTGLLVVSLEDQPVKPKTVKVSLTVQEAPKPPVDLKPPVEPKPPVEHPTTKQTTSTPNGKKQTATTAGPVVSPPPEPNPPPPPPPAQEFPPAVDCHGPNYGGLPSGRLTWTGELPPSGTLVFGRDRHVLSGPAGILKGDPLPGCDVNVGVPAGLAIEEPPNRANHFSMVKVRNTSNGTIPGVTMSWTVK
jgi:serine/threonine-protein kinase